MNIYIDTHTHTLQSNHATPTLTEIIEEARKKGLVGICVTNHGPAYGDSPSEAYFKGLSRLPKKDGKFHIIKGAEVNILDNSGKIDLTDDATINIIFNFLYEKGDEIKTTKQSPENGKVVFNLTNYNNSLGTGVTVPIEIGLLNDKKIYIVFYVYRLGKETLPILDVSLYLEV